MFPESGVRVAEKLDGILSQAPPLAETRETPLQLLMRDGVAPLARHFGMSARTLRRHCARVGLRLDVQRRTLRRELVMTLLATDLPIAEVANRLGYASSQTLARFLKKSFGVTATQVRRQNRSKAELPGSSSRADRPSQPTTR